MNGLSYGDNCWCDSIELMDVAGAGYSGKHHSLWQATLYRRDSNHGLWPQTLILIFWFSKADFAFSHRPVVEKKQPRILDQCDKCMITQRPLLSVGLWCLTGGDYWPSSPLHHTWPKVFAVSICDIFRGSRRKWSWKTGRVLSTSQYSSLELMALPAHVCFSNAPPLWCVHEIWVDLLCMSWMLEGTSVLRVRFWPCIICSGPALSTTPPHSVLVTEDLKSFHLLIESIRPV